MPAIITCPRCQRRLHLPDEFHEETVQCPSCLAEFPAVEAPTVTAARPKHVPTLEHYKPEDDAGPRRESRSYRPRYSGPPVKKPTRGPAFLVGVLTVVALVLACGLIGIGYAISESGGLPAPRPARQVQAKLDEAAAHARRGDSLLEAGKFPEAAKAYRKALDLDPKNADAYLGLLRSLRPADNRDDLGTRFAKLDNPRGNFDTFAADCEERQAPESLEPLAQAMCNIDPDYAPAVYYLAVSKARLQQTDRAVVLFKAALEKQPDARKRAEYVQGFLKAMASAGKFTSAYEAAPDPNEAFRTLAAEAMRGYQVEGLKQLLAVHGKTFPGDPLLPWYRAELYVREGRYPLADKTFAAALAQPPDEETLKTFRAGRVLARYYTGHALDAYGDIGPRQDTFLQMAALAFNDDNDDQLVALLDAHAKNDPDSIDVLCYHYRLKIRQDQVDDGIALFKTALEKAPSDDKRQEMVTDFLVDLVSVGKPVEGYRAAPDAKEAFRILADELFEEGYTADLPRLVEAHRQREPADPWLAYYQGEVHLQEKAWDKAAQVFGEGLKQAPKDLQDSLRWRYVFAMYKAGRGLRAYAEVEPHDNTFTQLANLLVADKKPAELESLIDAHRTNATDVADLLFFEALAKVLAQRPAEATALFREAFQKQTVDYKRTHFVSRFLTAMREAGHMLEGYRAVADWSVAFETLAAELVAKKNDKELATLLNEFGKGHAAEPAYQFYTGELHLLRGDAKQAEASFASGLAKSASEDQWRYRGGLFRARVKSGSAVVTYQENEPGTRTFEELANLCVQEKDAKQLQALIDAHRKADPDEPHLPAWELEVKWLNQDYEGVLQLLNDHREDVFTLPRWRWKANDYRVRALVRLKRTKDAVREAQAIVKRSTGDRLLLALAHAAGGDVKQTIAALEKPRPPDYLLRRCYQDEDLGPILRTDAFQGFREKFPEPKEIEGLGGKDPDEP